MRKVLFILSQLADDDLDWMVQNGTKVTYSEGRVLIQEGKQIEVLFVVLDGQLSVSLAALDNKQIAVLRSGEILGELSFLDSRPPGATVTAIGEATVLSIPRASLNAKMQEDLGFAARFYRALGVFLAHRLRLQTVRNRGGDPLRTDVEIEDELDPELLDSVALAAKRFEWIRDRFSGQ